MYLTLSDVRKVRWGKSYLWDVQFPGGPAYASPYAYPPDPPELFRDWFPAYSVQEPVFNISQMPISLPTIDFQIPKSLAYGELSISFYDDIFENAREWLWRWVMWMFAAVPDRTTGTVGQGGTAVRTLAECVRPVYVTRYTEYKFPSMIRQYYVYPSNSMIAALNSDSGLLDYTVTFTVVAGMFTLNVPEPTSI